MCGSNREKLIELLVENWIDFVKFEPVDENIKAKFMTLHIDDFVNFLLANGVTFATDTNVGSNADRIRAMSDEEIADVLDKVGADPFSYCASWWLDWLKQPAKGMNDD